MNADRIKQIWTAIALVVVAGLLVGLGVGVAPVRAGGEVEEADLASTRVADPLGPIRDEPPAAPPLSPQPGAVAQTVHNYAPWFSYRNNSGQMLDRLDLYVAIPPDRDNQTLTHFSFSDPYELLIDRYGQQVAHFRWSDLAPDEAVGVSWEWTAQVSTLDYDVDPNQVGDLDDIPAGIRALYTENGNMYRLESPIIRAAAAQAVQGAGRLYDQAYSIYRLVIDHLVYNQDGRWDDAERVYLQRHGSCTEHAWLYIALCRANGIPARYAGGMMSMSANHRWAEVYLPPYGWVPVDPTWESFGVAPARVMVTTVGGGGSEYLDWTYNWLEWKNRADVFLSPLTQTALGLPSAWANYTIDVHNESGSADRFDLSLSGNSWETELSHTSTGELEDGSSFRLTVRMRVPDTPTSGDQDTATIHAVSSSDPGSRAGSATVMTVADLPPQIKVSPAALDSVQPPGATTTYSLDLHNLGTSDFMFSIQQALPLNAALLLSLNERGAAELFMDGSGHGNHATCSGTSCPDSNAWSPRGWAAEFDGVEDRIVTPLYLDQSVSSPGATMAAWVYPTSSGEGLHHVLSTDDGGHDWSILHENGMWAFFDGEARRHTSFTVDLNRWQHVAAVFRPGEGVAFYKNGQGEHFYTLGYDESSGNVILGDNAGPWPEFFQGKIDEVQVYPTPFKPIQVYILAQERERADWLSWDVAYGRLTSLDTRTIQFTLDASGLSPDTFAAQVAVISNDPNCSRINVPVTMVVADQTPEINVTPTSLAGELLQGESLTRTLTISNSGTAALEVELSTLAQAVPWLSTDPISATVAPGGEQAVQVTLDATGVETGTHSAQIRIASNDPVSPVLDVPVAMTVRQVVAEGRVQGTVTDVDTGAPLSATVSVFGGPVSTETNASGAYSLTLEAGSYTLQATAAGYFTQTASVQVRALAVSTQDFALRALEPEQTHLYLPLVIR